MPQLQRESALTAGSARRPRLAELLLRLVEYGRRYRRLRLNLRHQHRVLPQSRERAADPGTTTDFLINYPGSPSSLDDLMEWIPVLHRLNESATVSILLGDVSAYQAVHGVTDLPCYFGRIAGEAEYVAQQLQTKVMLYVNQSRLNLREAGFHDMLHVYLGAPGDGRNLWLSNRMRLYDYVLAPDEDSKAWLASRLIAFDADRHVRVVGHRDEPTQRPGDGTMINRIESRLSVPSVVERGVDPDAVITELLQIRDERDRLVAERDAALADQGIVLRKGGQA
jgi:hypothetical protein